MKRYLSINADNNETTPILTSAKSTVKTMFILNNQTVLWSESFSKKVRWFMPVIKVVRNTNKENINSIIKHTTTCNIVYSLLIRSTITFSHKIAWIRCIIFRLVFIVRNYFLTQDCLNYYLSMQPYNQVYLNIVFLPSQHKTMHRVIMQQSQYIPETDPRSDLTQLQVQWPQNNRNR